MYNFYRPSISEVTFLNNSAEYGPNIGSYAIRAVLLDNNSSTLVLEDIASGMVIDKTIIFELKDYDNQTMILDNASSVTIKSNQKDSLVINNMVKTIRGRAVFDSLLFTASPGLQNVNYSLHSEGIKLEGAKKQLGENYSLGNIAANFRQCRPGEYRDSDV